jgi:hypothetical protein
MNKFSIFALLLSVVFAAGAFAADTKVAAPVVAPATTTVSGAVVSYTAADAVKKTAAVLVVKVADKETSFAIDAKAVLTGKDKKALDLTTLKAGDLVAVEFTTADKVNTAVAVTAK